MNGYEPDFIAHIRLTEEAIQANNKVLSMHHITSARRFANKFVAENEGLKGDSNMLLAMLKSDYQAFLDLTEKVDEHVEGYERECLCAVCRSYGD